ncbi:MULTISPECIES: antibiotic biosynthesis monooxygenase family protein [Luteimonas]|uniref:antibiotic biosynthesis monooxygenase family protein n=1 Tax=Luteimonas TaxID=83614 RepID=UPI000C7BBF64|nr:MULTISPECIES: antibiotic biosynthesis monooxygenase [Luteimonas]
MITELALLRIGTGMNDPFEAAFRTVAPLLRQADGYLRHRLVRTLDHDETYLLDVDWRDLAAHVAGFEPSETHARFMAALAPFLVGEPTVVHVPSHVTESE